MAVKTFAAVSIGSAVTEMKIFEFTQKRAMREIECVSTRMNLGLDVYEQGRISREHVDELCAVLNDFKRTMSGYRVDAYRVFATSAFRESRNKTFLCDYIEKQTGLEIDVFTNSEQRFVDYQAIASVSAEFESIIANATAIVDISGSSTQISLFDKDKLITTQNIRVGNITTRENLLPISKNGEHFERLIRELMDYELTGFTKLYQKDRKIRNLIVLGGGLSEMLSMKEQEEIQELLRKRELEISKTAALSRTAAFSKNAAPSPNASLSKGTDASASDSSKVADSAVKAGIRLKDTDGTKIHSLSKEQYEIIYEYLIAHTPDEIAKKYQLPSDMTDAIIPSAVICRSLIESFDVDVVWMPGFSLNDGVAYDYGVRMGLLTRRHSFDEDILAAARSISKRYKTSQSHIRNIGDIAVEIFDRMKKVHGLGARERLLLQIAVILHSCGKFISLTDVSECAYNIILATEIIGLSQEERSIVAYTVKYNTSRFIYYDELETKTDLDEKEYMIVAKLTAILRIANSLDRTHQQKCENLTVTLKEHELRISVASQADLSLERGAFEEKVDFFEEVFNVRPVLKQKKSVGAL
ncbi:MAG: exopolyphosphatase [Lachnospiraceae bacterium]|nr:exopolyphosphatase [Lachnospiraceae bacterium]